VTVPRACIQPTFYHSPFAAKSEKKAHVTWYRCINGKDLRHTDWLRVPPTTSCVALSSPYCQLGLFFIVSKMLITESAAVLVALALLPGCAFFYILYGLLINYNAARKTGLPLVILPFDSGHPLWMIIDRKVVQLVRRIPFGSGTFTRFNWRGWEIWDRYRAHQELGDGIIFVTPGKNYLQLCDAEAVSEIFQRRVDFPRPPEVTGKNITLLLFAMPRCKH